MLLIYHTLRLFCVYYALFADIRPGIIAIHLHDWTFDFVGLSILSYHRYHFSVLQGTFPRYTSGLGTLGQGEWWGVSSAFLPLRPLGYPPRAEAAVAAAAAAARCSPQQQQQRPLLAAAAASLGAAPALLPLRDEGRCRERGA